MSFIRGVPFLIFLVLIASAPVTLLVTPMMACVIGQDGCTETNDEVPLNSPSFIEAVVSGFQNRWILGSLLVSSVVIGVIVWRKRR